MSDTGKTQSVFLSNMHHAFAQVDGTYRFPNSFEGDQLKQAMVEIAKLERENQELRAQLAENAEIVRIAKKLMSAYDESLAKTEGKGDWEEK